MRRVPLLKRDIRPQIAAIIVLLVVLVVVGLYSWQAISYRPHNAATAAACLSNLKQLATGFSIYAADYDETAMPAENWNSVLSPYFKPMDLLHCPKLKHDFDKNSFGYAYNFSLSKARLPALGRREGTILFFETSVFTPDATGGADIVAKPSRHVGKNGFAYLDGKAKMVKDGENPGSWFLSPTR